MTGSLSPCPRCNCTNVDKVSHHDGVFIRCVACRQEGPKKDTEQEAVDAWNKRIGLARIMCDIASKR